MDIYDNNGDTIDRYTIFLNAGCDDAIGADINGYGFYQHLKAKRGRHLGKKIPFTALSTELRMKLARE